MTIRNINNELKEFYGTGDYYKWSVLFPDTLTDGALYVAETFKCYWLMDIIASYQREKKFLDNHEFQVWTIRVNKSQHPYAVVVADDGNKNILTTQEIEYTDLPDLSEIKLYYCNGVILLPSEY